MNLSCPSHLQICVNNRVNLGELRAVSATVTDFQRKLIFCGIHKFLAKYDVSNLAIIWYIHLNYKSIWLKGVCNC